MRRLEGGKDFDIIALTANALSGAEEKYKKLGFNDFLAKPIEPQSMDQVLRKHLPDELIQARVGGGKGNADPLKEEVMEFAPESSESSEILEFSPNEDAEILEFSAEEAPGEAIAENAAGASVEQKKTHLKESCPELDISTGMVFCMGDWELYEELLADYISDTKIDALEKAYEKEDLKNYAISVHALKVPRRPSVLLHLASRP